MRAPGAIRSAGGQEDDHRFICNARSVDRVNDFSDGFVEIGDHGAVRVRLITCQWSERREEDADKKGIVGRFFDKLRSPGGNLSVIRLRVEIVSDNSGGLSLDAFNALLKELHLNVIAIHGWGSDDEINMLTK